MATRVVEIKCIGSNGKYVLKLILELFFINLFSMKKAVPLINAIDTGRFPRLLIRILQKLHLKVCTSVFLWLVTPLIPLKLDWENCGKYCSLVCSWELQICGRFDNVLWSKVWGTLYSVINLKKHGAFQNILNTNVWVIYLRVKIRLWNCFISVYNVLWNML